MPQSFCNVPISTEDYKSTLPHLCQGCVLAVGLLDVTNVCFLQGEMLDNIELNVMHTVDHVEKARDETKRAVKYKGQARKVRLALCFQGRESMWFAVSCLFSSLSLSAFALPPLLASGEREP